MYADNFDAIRDRAYALWEAAGRPDGQDEHFWHEAERELRELHELDEDGEGDTSDKPGEEWIPSIIPLVPRI